MPVVNFILNNHVMIFELIGLLIILFISVHISPEMKLYTRITILFLFIAVIVENVEAWTQRFEKYNVARSLLTATKYSIYPLILIIINEMMSVGRKKHPLKIKLLFLLPEIIAVPLYFSSQWTHLIFYVNEKNEFISGPIRFLPYGIFVFYLIGFIVKNIMFLRYYETRDRIILLFITLGAFILVVLHMIFSEKKDYTAIFTSAMVFYFLFIYIHMASIDPLTGLMNRQIYYQDLAINHDKIQSVVSLDMNELKYYNDNFGHDKGDEALKVVANVIKTSSASKKVYRIGGDEFIIFYSIYLK